MLKIHVSLSAASNPEQRLAKTQARIDRMQLRVQGYQDKIRKLSQEILGAKDLLKYLKHKVSAPKKPPVRPRVKK